jgi:hypothetical protein
MDRESNKRLKIYGSHLTIFNELDNKPNPFEEETYW